MRRKTRSISLKDCYAILGISKDASLDDIKHAYRRKAFELHPDLNPDDPEAGKKFQFLNEAYVALSALMEKKEGNRDTKAEKEQEKEEAGTQETSREEEKGKESHKEEENEEKRQEQKKREQADKAYAEQDVLRDLLNDPFARRVFEDIYSELNKQQAGKKEDTAQEQKKAEARTETRQSTQSTQASQHANRTTPRPKEKPHTTLHKGNIAWNTPKWDSLKGGVGGYVKNWFKRQIDEELRLTLPAAALVPGRRVRLQIRHGISNEIHTIEVTLPPDFALGKPIRLRGLGRHVGPWQGDLYLILESS